MVNSDKISKLKVGCLSGLKGRFAKPLARKCHTGSNPVPTAASQLDFNISPFAKLRASS